MVSLYTAMVIQGQGDNIVCEPYGQHKETGKWAGAINLYHGGFFHTTLLSSEPIYDTIENAIEDMKTVVEQIRKIDLNPQHKQLENIVGKEEMAVVGAIVNASQR